MVYSSNDPNDPENNYAHWQRVFVPNSLEYKVMQKKYKTSNYAPSGYGEESALRTGIKDSTAFHSMYLPMESIPEERNMDYICWKYPQWLQSYVSAPALTSATASTGTSTTVRYIPDGQSTDRSHNHTLPTKL